VGALPNKNMPSGMFLFNSITYEKDRFISGLNFFNFPYI